MMQSFPTAEQLADAVARHVVACAGEAISARGRFTVTLSGGSTPRAAYARLASEDLARRVDWRRVHVLWGDERCVPPDDPQSNYRMAKEALLDRVPIPAQQIHRIRGEDEPERAAAEYERELRELLTGDVSRQGEGHPERSSSHPERQRRISQALDLVLLGLGDDGHTASLFPGQPAVYETSRWVTAVPPGVPGSPPFAALRASFTAHRSPDIWRVTLTPAILNTARNVTFIVSGASKAARLQQVIEGPFTPELLPAQAIRPHSGRLNWMVDAAAGSRLRPSTASTSP